MCVISSFYQLKRLIIKGSLSLRKLETQLHQTGSWPPLSSWRFFSQLCSRWCWILRRLTVWENNHWLRDSWSFPFRGNHLIPPNGKGTAKSKRGCWDDNLAMTFDNLIEVIGPYGTGLTNDVKNYSHDVVIGAGTGEKSNWINQNAL